jgi:hypothetical protein
MIDVDNDRTLYTSHGQHLNFRGKENMANKIASTIKCMLAKKVEPISAKWYLYNETPETPTPTANDQDSEKQGSRDGKTNKRIHKVLKYQRQFYIVLPLAAIQERVTEVLRSIPKEAFADSFQKLYERCQQCVVKDGDYFEGQ